MCLRYQRLAQTDQRRQLGRWRSVNGVPVDQHASRALHHDFWSARCIGLPSRVRARGVNSGGDATHDCECHECPKPLA